MRTRFFILFLFVWTGIQSSESLNQELILVNDLYRQGLAASTLESQQKAFNESLKTYLDLEKNYPNSPQLSAAIGNNLFNIGEYSWAIFYYYKALKEGSDDENITMGILKAEQKLNLPPSIQFSPQDNFFSFNQKIKLGWRYQLLFSFMLVTFIFASLTIWFPLRYFFYLRNLFSFFSIIILLNLLFSYFIIPNEAIVIHTSPLYRSPTLDLQDPLPIVVMEGTKVRVLDIQKGAKAIKIEDKKGMGYMSLSSIAIL